MTDNDFQEIKQEYIENIRSKISELGGLHPHITIFADVNDAVEGEDHSMAILILPIEDEYMKDDQAKDEFVDDILPGVFKKINEQFTPKALAWASEAWIRTIEKNEEMPDNYKELPIKKEVVIISIESDNSNECLIYEINRKGKQITRDGNLVDTITLEQINGFTVPKETTGRFAGLFKKLKN